MTWIKIPPTVAGVNRSQHQRLLARRPDPNEGNARARKLRHSGQVGPRLRGKLRGIGDAAEVLLPALVLLVNRLAALDLLHGGRRVGDALAIQLVVGADADLV